MRRIEVGTKTHLIYDHPVLFNYWLAILSAKTTHKLVVANMTKAAVRVADPALWNVMAIGVNQYLGSYISHDTLFFILVGTFHLKSGSQSRIRDVLRTTRPIRPTRVTELTRKL